MAPSPPAASKPAADQAGCDARRAFLPARPVTLTDLAAHTERVRRRVIRWFRLTRMLDAADPDSLRLTGALPAVVPASPRWRSRPQHYLGGKPPMAWLSRAHTAGKAALATGTALWFKRGLL